MNIDLVDSDDDLDDDDITIIDETQTNNRRALAIQIYKSVWDDFSAWDYEDNRLAIARLAVQGSSALAYSDTDLSYDDLIDESPGYTSNASPVFTICDYDPHGVLLATSGDVYTSEGTVPESLDIPPHPRYQACALSSRNILNIEKTSVDPDWTAPKVTQFIAYADDVAFPLTSYLDFFDDFAWQTKFKDPNGTPCFPLEDDLL